ncbi:MAG: DUF3090 family protein [Chloroflexota bacterium]|nr:DUF3090 family protein [Chloroflexota bacterium]
MAEATYDFGPIDELKPEALGVPGQRRFRILFRRENRSACFWMEKEQLGALADAVNELLSQISGGKGQGTPPPRGIFPEPFEIEIQTGRLALGYNEATDLFLLLFYDIEAEIELREEAQTEDELEDASLNMTPTFRCEASRGQLEAFYNESASVIQSGRPLPPSRNGHFKTT